MAGQVTGSNFKVCPNRATTRIARRRFAMLTKDTSCPPTKPMSCPSTNQTSSPTTNITTRKDKKEERCMRPGPLQRNPYLNFLREYRKKMCGLSPVETIRQGAKAWKCLTAEEKAKYVVQAFYTRRKTLRNRGRRRSGKSKSTSRSRKSRRRNRK